MVTRGQTMSEERKKLIAAGREQARVRQRITGYPVGCRVRVISDAARSYKDRVGTVSEHNMGEVGVLFGVGGSAVWFAPAQLTRIREVQ